MQIKLEYLPCTEWGIGHFAEITREVDGPLPRPGCAKASCGCAAGTMGSDHVQ